MTRLETRLSRLEAGGAADGDQPFPFGINYLIVRDANQELAIERSERYDYCFHHPELRAGEYIASETPLLMTNRQLDELLKVIDGKTRTI